MPRAETGNGVSAVRSNDKVTVAAWEGNTLRRVRGCLSASGVFRSMTLSLSGVIVAVAGICCVVDNFPSKLSRYNSRLLVQ